MSKDMNFTKTQAKSREKSKVAYHQGSKRKYSERPWTVYMLLLTVYLCPHLYAHPSPRDPTGPEGGKLP